MVHVSKGACGAGGGGPGESQLLCGVRLRARNRLRDMSIPVLRDSGGHSIVIGIMINTDVIQQIAFEKYGFLEHA